MKNENIQEYSQQVRGLVAGEKEGIVGGLGGFDLGGESSTHGVTKEDLVVGVNNNPAIFKKE